MANPKYRQWLTSDGLTLLEGWARNGLNDEQIASNMGIACSTLYVWKNDHPEIAEALKKGKEVVDLEVENALLKKALGYDYVETTIEELADGKKRVRQTTKHVQGDTVAQIFWLKNRKPEVWREKQAPATEDIEDIDASRDDVYGKD